MLSHHKQGALFNEMPNTTGKTETFVGQRQTEVSSKPTEIDFFCWVWANFRRLLTDGSFSMKVTPTEVS
jgi:hypothetical protein